MTTHINVLGPPVIDGAVKLPRKAKALLAYLALQPGRTSTRERVADLLWPHQTSEHARHSLRNCLLEVRKALGPEAIDATYTDVRLPPVVGSDVDEFLALAADGSVPALTSAADLHRGELLDGFHIDSEPWSEWIEPQRRRLNDVALIVLVRLADLRVASGEHDLAILAARRAVTLDPYSEEYHRRLMRTLHAAGRRPEAILQYHVCVDLLWRELKVAPSEETYELARSLGMTDVEESIPVPDVNEPTPTVKVKVQKSTVTKELKKLTSEVSELRREVKEANAWRIKYELLVERIKASRAKQMKEAA